MTEKLLTLKEAATTLGLSEEEMRKLVERGDIPAYQIGGMYLRFKEEQILFLKDKYPKKDFASSPKKLITDSKGQGPFVSHIKDFFYFNDFYIISAILIIGLFYIILKSIK